jgi:hypothetical protein
MERVFSHVGLSRISLFITMRLFCSQAVCMSYANATKLVSVHVLLFYRNYFYVLKKKEIKLKKTILVPYHKKKKQH